MKREKIIIAFVLLIFLISFSGYQFKIYNINKKISQLTTNNIIINNNEIDFNSLTLKQKLSQMIMIRGDYEDFEFTNFAIGGVFLDRQKKQENYKQLINSYQKNSKIRLFASTDLEGAWNPFADSEMQFPHFSDIQTKQQAYETGLEHGQLLKQTGFNMNFAPVAEYSDKAYGGRTFNGTKQEIAEKIENYILGLQKNVHGTCKHYPGKAMKKNLHEVTDKQNITEDDLYLFEICLKNNISSIMVSHQIVYGELNSDNKPSSVSEKVVSSVNNSALIIADEINMNALKSFYPDKSEIYAELINSGENLILDFDLSPHQLLVLLDELEKQAEFGGINASKIDNSVEKILVMKGYRLV